MWRFPDSYVRIYLRLLGFICEISGIFAISIVYLRYFEFICEILHIFANTQNPPLFKPIRYTGRAHHSDNANRFVPSQTLPHHPGEPLAARVPLNDRV